MTAGQLVQGAPRLEQRADEGGLGRLPFRHVQRRAADGAVEQDPSRPPQLLSHSRGHGDSLGGEGLSRLRRVAVVGCLPQSLDDSKREVGVGAPLRRRELELVGAVEPELLQEGVERCDELRRRRVIAQPLIESLDALREVLLQV